MQKTIKTKMVAWVLLFTMLFTIAPTPTVLSKFGIWGGTAYATTYTNSSITAMTKNTEDLITSVTVSFTTSDTAANLKWFLAVGIGNDKTNQKVDVSASNNSDFSGFGSNPRATAETSGNGNHTMIISADNGFSSDQMLRLYIWYDNKWTNDQYWSLQTLVDTYEEAQTKEIQLPSVDNISWTVNGTAANNGAKVTVSSSPATVVLTPTGEYGFTQTPTIDGASSVIMNLDGSVTAVVPVTGTVTLGTPNPAPVQGVRVNFKDGESVIASQFVTNNGTVNEPVAPTKEGSAFDGWGKGDDYFDFTKPIEEETTLTVKWIAADQTYPYGQAMSTSEVTLCTDVYGQSYQWQVADSVTGIWSDISGATSKDYIFTPTAGNWYRCVVNNNEDTATKAVQLIKSGNTFTKPNTDQWYVSNGTMAYTVWDQYQFDVVGQYDGKWIGSAFGGSWAAGGTSDPEETKTYSTSGLTSFKITFRANNDRYLDFAIQLANNSTAMAFGTDTMLNGVDSCPLKAYAVSENDASLDRIVMKTSNSEGAATMVIRPTTPTNSYWVGQYITASYGIAYPETNKTSISGYDSSMAISWKDLAAGSVVRASISLGTPEETSANMSADEFAALAISSQDLMYDGLTTGTEGSTTAATESTLISALSGDYEETLVENLVTMLGIGNDTSEAGTDEDGNDLYTDREANRDILQQVNSTIDTLLAGYDNLSEEGKREVAAQMIEDTMAAVLENNASATLEDLANALVNDVKTNNSTIAAYAATMAKVEASNPTIGAVTDVAYNEDGNAVISIAGLTGTGAEGENTFTSDEVDTVTVEYFDPDANDGNGAWVALEGTYEDGAFTVDGTIPADATAIRTTVTDTNGFDVVTTTNVVSSTVTAAYVEGATNPNADNALDSTIAVNPTETSAEATLTEAGDSYTVWAFTGVTYATNGGKDGTNAPGGQKSGNAAAAEQAITLTATPDDGVYSDFYVTVEQGGKPVDVKLTADNVKTLLGENASLVVDSTTGVQTLTYKASEAAAKNAKEITTKTRDLIGEINADTTGDTIEFILNNDDENFVTIFDRVDTAVAGTVSGTDALKAWVALTDDEKTAAATMLSNEITEGVASADDEGYTVSEFNAALKAAAEYVNGLDALKAVLNIDEETGLPVKDENGNYVRKPGVTAGSYDEAAKVYEAVVTAYATVTDGEGTIATDELQTLADKLAKAEAQLVESTSGVQISGAGLPDGVTVTATATFPEDVEGSAKTVAVTNEQDGYVFPKYNTAVTVSIPVKPSADTEENYNVVVTVDGEALTNEVGTLVKEDQAYKLTLTGVKEPMDVSIDYVRKDVTANKLPAIITSITDAKGTAVEITGEGADRTATIAEAAGTDVTLTLAAPKDEAGNVTGTVLPDATVTIDGKAYPVVTDSNGNVTVAVPSNVLANVDSGALAEALSKAFTADNEKLAGLEALAKAVIDNQDAYSLANENNNDYTEDSWNDLKAAYDAVAAAGESVTAAQINALEATYNALVPQYAVNVPNGLNIPLKAVEVEEADPENEGATITVTKYVPVQDGVVIAAATGDDADKKVTKVFVAEGISLQLITEPNKGESVDQITYKMDKNGDGDTEDSVDQTSTAYPAGGIITIPKITGTVTIEAPQTSANGFAVENGPLGNATGKAETVGDGEAATDTYTITPGEGSEVTSVTVDGTTVALPNAEELKAIVEAANAADAEWTGTTSKSYTVDDVNGKDVTFTKDTAQEADGAIIATLPGIGKVSVVKDADTGMITATVLAAGTDKLPVGTEIVLDGAVSGTGTDKSVTLTDEVIRPADAKGNVTDTEIVVLNNGKDGAGTDGDAVMINFGDTNTGSHGVSATTTLKTYDLAVDIDGEDAADTADIKINGKTNDTVKHGDAVTVTIAAPAADGDNAGKEVSMDTKLSGTFNGKDLTDATLAELDAMDGVEVTINNDGSATIKVAEAAGAFAVTAAEVAYADKDTNANANTLAGNKAAVNALADELKILLATATGMQSNDGALYDENSDAWNALYKDDVDEAAEGTQTLLAKDTAFNTTLQNALPTIAAASDDSALLDALNTVLGVKDTDNAHNSVADAINALEVVNNTLETAVNAAKNALADGVITLPTTVTVGSNDKAIANNASNAIGIAPISGKLNVGTGGKDLTIGNIDMAEGYLPKVTFAMANGEEKILVVERADNDNGYQVRVNGVVTGAVNVTLDANGFDLTIKNGNLTDVLGSNGTLGNIKSITVSGEKQGIILPSADALQAGMQTGSTNAVNGEITMKVDENDVNAGKTPVVSVGSTATLTIPLSQDDYFGNVTTGSALGTVWHKEVAGVEIDGTLYKVQNDGTLLAANGEKLAGVTVAYNGDTEAVITLDTNAEDFDEELPYETLQIVAQPTNSQYRTFKSEFAAIEALVTDPEGTEDATKAQLEDAIKSVEKLIAEAKGILPAPYALTQQNKDYLMDEIAQLDAYKDKLEAMYNAAKVEADIETLYDAVNDIIPLDEPITEDDKATLAAMEEAIVDMQNAYNDLTGYEQSLVSAEAKAMLDQMQDALRQAQQDGMTAAEQFRAVVSDIAKAVCKDGEGIDGDNADLINAMIDAAEDLYIAMDDSNKTASATAKATLDDLKDKLNAYAEQAAKDFAKDYLTTSKGTALAANGSNRIDSNAKAADYADRLLEAKQAYDNLSAVERAAVDNLFNGPTVPQLYKDTFEVQGATILTDAQIADNFVQKYLSINGAVITEATDKNSGKILAAKDAYDALTDDQKALVTKALTKANNGRELSYPDLLQDAQMAGAMNGTNGSSGALLHSMSNAEIDALNLSAAQKQAMKDARDFIKRHLMEDGSVIIAANDSNYSTILAANSPYNRLSDLAKAAVNNALTGTYKGQTYPALLGDAQATYNRLHPSSGSGFSGKYNYPVRVNDVAGGKVDLSEEYVVAGDTVTITVTPDAGKTVSSVIVIGPDGQMIPVTQVSANVFTFTMPAGEVKISIIMGNANDDVKIVLMIGSPVVYVNGEKLINDVVPVIVNDRTMLPIRLIAENLGADVDWNAELRKVIITKGGTVMEIYIDEYIAYINGDPVQLDAAAFIENDRTYLQVRFISETLGCKVGWDGTTQTVTIEGKR